MHGFIERNKQKVVIMSNYKISLENRAKRLMDGRILSTELYTSISHLIDTCKRCKKFQNLSAKDPWDSPEHYQDRVLESLRSFQYNIMGEPENSHIFEMIEGIRDKCINHECSYVQKEITRLHEANKDQLIEDTTREKKSSKASNEKNGKGYYN